MTQVMRIKFNLKFKTKLFKISDQFFFYSRKMDQIKKNKGYKN